MAAAETPKKKSDLGVRTVSAVVMVAVAGTALWLGGWAWTGFVAAVALCVLWEWTGLTRALTASPVARGLWNAGGVLYIGCAAAMLLFLRSPFFSPATLLAVLLAVIATDIGAYFAGRTFGGPKIAPAISPSKTWSGLGGGITGAALVALIWLAAEQGMDWPRACVQALPMGALVAIVAQAGDFFESWMKRRAGVKDSGKLIPGHGGLFDRVDGLLAVLFVLGIVTLAFGGFPGIG